jgi:hypothetical protein
MTISVSSDDELDLISGAIGKDLANYRSNEEYCQSCGYDDYEESLDIDKATGYAIVPSQWWRRTRVCNRCFECRAVL